MDQSDLSLHCLLDGLLKHFSRRQKQTTFVVIGVLRVKIISLTLCLLLSSWDIFCNQFGSSLTKYWA